MEYMESQMQTYLTSMEDVLYATLDEGDEAYEQGIPLSENPYAEGSWMARAWNDGWTSAAELAAKDAPQSSGDV